MGHQGAPGEVYEWLNRHHVEHGTLDYAGASNNISYTDRSHVWVKVSRDPWAAARFHTEYAGSLYAAQNDLWAPKPLCVPGVLPDGRQVSAFAYVPESTNPPPPAQSHIIASLWREGQKVHRLPPPPFPLPDCPKSAHATVTDRMNTHGYLLPPRRRRQVWSLLDETIRRWDRLVNIDTFVVSHADLHYGNAVWLTPHADTDSAAQPANPGKSDATIPVGLLDWESLRWAPPEWDAATLYRWGQSDPDGGGEAFLSTVRGQRWFDHGRFLAAYWLKSLTLATFGVLHGDSGLAFCETALDTLQHDIEHGTVTVVRAPFVGDGRGTGVWGGARKSWRQTVHATPPV